MTISVLYTKSFGQLIADVEENIDGTYTLNVPCIIQVGNNQVGLIPLLATVKEQKFQISKEDLISDKLFEPEDDIRNYYNSNYGSGLQLVTSQSSIIK